MPVVVRPPNHDFSITCLREPQADRSFKVNFSRELVMVRPPNHDLPIKHLREPQADRIVLLLAQIVQAGKFPTEPRYGTHIKKADHL
jgi:hypothetical protein